MSEVAQHATSARIAGIGVPEELVAVEQMAVRVRQMLAKLSRAVLKKRSD